MTARFLIGISMRFSGLVFSAFLGLSLAAGAVSAADSSCDSRPLLRIGYIENSFSPSERWAFEATFRYLREKLPQYKFSIDTFLVRDLEKGVGLGQFEFFIGSSGFYRRVFRRGLKDLATLTTPVAPDPNEAVATVFMVPKDSPAKTVADLRGMRAAANFELGFTVMFVPLGEIAAQGFDPDSFFRAIVPAGSPMKKLLLAVEEGKADVALARACTVEELQAAEPEFTAKFRPIGLKENKHRFACMRSTEAYPNWTFVATNMAPWQASRDLTVALLSMPETQEGFGWGVVSDFLKVDELYKTLRRGPYSYLRIQSVQDFVEKYWPFISLFLMAVVGLVLHGRRVTQLVDQRTRELRLALQRQKDATEEAQSARERLSQFERISVIGAMSSLIAHEINGPVSAISNSCSALERTLENEPDHNPMFDKSIGLIERQCDKITRIVTLVRNYAKSREMQTETIEVGAALERIVSVMQLRYSDVRITLERPMRGVCVEWNPLEFELCVSNLIKNGTQACCRTQEAHVAVVVTLHEYTVEIAVSDNAPEDPQAMENAASPLNSSKENGLGLGLLIVRTLVERTAGSFSIVREADRTVARIRVPLSENQNA